MTDEEIKSEIENDPESLGYAGKSNGEKAVIINRVDRPGRRPPTYAMVRRWATENATLIRAQRHSADPAESDEQLASICISFLHGAPADIMDTRALIINNPRRCDTIQNICSPALVR